MNARPLTVQLEFVREKGGFYCKGHNLCRKYGSLGRRQFSSRAVVLPGDLQRMTLSRASVRRNYAIAMDPKDVVWLRLFLGSGGGYV